MLGYKKGRALVVLLFFLFHAAAITYCNLVPKFKLEQDGNVFDKYLNTVGAAQRIVGRILPFQQCTGLTNINDTFPLCEQGIYNHGGNGQHNWKYDISIGEQGAETLPTGSGLSGTTFG